MLKIVGNYEMDSSFTPSPTFRLKSSDPRFWKRYKNGLSRKCIFHVQIQAAITGFQTFNWSGRTASPQLIQWTVRIIWFGSLDLYMKYKFSWEATSPLFLSSNLYWLLSEIVEKFRKFPFSRSICYFCIFIDKIVF